MPKRGVLAFARNHPKHTTHELQHTAGTTSPSVTPWEFAGVVWEVACMQLGETRMGPRHRQNGGQRRERHFRRSWWPLEWHVASSEGRALLPTVPPFVTQRNLLNQATRKSQYMPKRKAYFLLLPCCALDEGFQGALGSAKWHVVRNECHDMKGKIVGHYIGHNSPPAPPGGSKRI
jgi:hypothetical protein